MKMHEIFEMQDLRRDDLRKSAVYSRHALTCIGREFGIDLKSSQLTWTDSDGDTEVWALNVGDFVMYPARVTRKSIRGEEFFDGWRIERVHVAPTMHNDSPFYEDVESETIYETTSWVHALEKLLLEGFIRKVAYVMDAHGTSYELRGNNNGN